MKIKKHIKILMIVLSILILSSSTKALRSFSSGLNKSHLISVSDEYMEAALDSGVPVLYVESDDELSDLKVDKELKAPAKIALYDESGAFLFEGKCDFKGHGNGTWDHEKRSWSIIFDNNTEFPGLTPGKGFVAVSNYQDPSFIRNKLVLDLSAETGLAYTSKSRYVHLYYNGEYLGFYLLMDRIEQGEYRVPVKAGNIEKKKVLRSYSLVTGDNVQGYDWGENKSDLDCGFMFVNGGHHPGEPHAGEYRIAYPKYASIYQAESLYDYYNEFLDAVSSESGINDKTGKSYIEYIDLDSFARKHLVEIISKNRDGNAVSNWYYIYSLAEQPAIFHGPAWDYDNTFGNYRGGDPRWRVPEGLDDLEPGLMKRREFMDLLANYYYAIYRPWVMENLDEHIESYRAEIRESVKLEQKRWPDNAYTDRSFDDAVDYVKEFTLKRIGFLDDIWLKGIKYHRLNFQYGDATIYTAYLKEGTPINEAAKIAEQKLKEAAPTKEFSGWYDEGYENLYDMDTLVGENIALWAK